MRRIINTLIITAVSVLAFSCQERPGLELAMNESIVLDLSSGVTKAADTDVESFVNHIDVIIFDEAGTEPGNKVYSGRYTVNNASSLTLSAKRSSFVSGQKYYVYLIANSTLPLSDYEAVATYNDLVDKKQEDYNLHLTALEAADAPKYFLMDAVAKDASDSSPVVLNNGVYTDNTVLEAVLTRAAAKVVVNITASENVEFKQFSVAEGSEGGLYYVRNMPYDTYILAEARPAEQIRTAKVRTTTKTNNAYFTWNPSVDAKHVSLVTYVYPNNWADNSILEREACVVMNLPMVYTSGESSVNHYNSWYKIPMTDEKMFKRNNYYEVNITLNRPGATEESTPIELNDIYYAVEEWVEQDIYVGGDDKPKYLSVNKTEMEMRNIAVDASTLSFASSSPVTITVKDIYYYNKLGQKTTVNPTITGTTEAGSIAGNITVNSPLPTNNAIRYFTLVVTNQDGITREVQVAQYPLEYITNQQGWYSYRSDFYTGTYNPTTYEYKGSRRTAANWGNNGWSYGTEYGEGYFFGSKVASMRTDGTSRLYYYRWTQNGTSASTDQGNLTALNNARMYHVQITASSGKYIVGIPKLDADGFTDDGEDNAKLVSPSFMIASQLGATLAPGSKEQAERHCREYVEVYDPDNNPQTNNAIHYDNWRLPTRAEVLIIIDFQYVPNAAMDEVLSGNYYWSATGEVRNPQSSSSGTQSAVRCIRDVY